jgi:transposase
MQTETPAATVETTARDHSNALFASLELSKAKWLVTANSPGEEKISKHVVEGGDGGSLC